MVSSCAGPIGVQNMEGELGTWGLMPPSSTLIDLANTDNPLTQITADTRQYPFTRPRFCVVLDYIVTHRKDVVLSFLPAQWIDGDSSIPLGAELKIAGPAETYYLIEREEILGCTASICFHVFDYESNSFIKVDTTMTAQTSGIFKFKVQVPVSELLNKQGLKEKNNNKFMAFAEIRFNGLKLASKAKYKRYNFDDAWFVRIKLAAGNGCTALYFDDTELPDFPWLGKYFSEKYSESLSPTPKNQSMKK